MSEKEKTIYNWREDKRLKVKTYGESVELSIEILDTTTHIWDHRYNATIMIKQADLEKALKEVER